MSSQVSFAKEIQINELLSIVVRKGAKKPTWQYRILDCGKYLQKTTKTMNVEEAKRIALDEYAKAMKRKYLGGNLKPTSFSELADMVHEEAEELPTKKRENRQRPIRLYYKQYFGDQDITLIDRKAIKKYIKWRKKQGRLCGVTDEDDGYVIKPSASTINNELGSLRAIFDMAVDENVIVKANIPEIKNESLKEQESRPTFWPEEMQKLRLEAYERYRTAKHHAYKRFKIDNKLPKDHVPTSETQAAFFDYWRNDRIAYSRFTLYYYIRILATTGMRPSTVGRLIYAHIRKNPKDLGNTKKGRVFMGKTKKGKKTREWAIVPTKEGQTALHEFVNNLRDREPTSKLFPKHPTHYARQFDRLLASMGLTYDEDGDKRTVYSLRHYYITSMLQEGVDIQIVARNTMTSPQTIAKYYDHIKTIMDYEHLNI